MRTCIPHNHFLIPSSFYSNHPHRYHYLNPYHPPHHHRHSVPINFPLTSPNTILRFLTIATIYPSILLQSWGSLLLPGSPSPSPGQNVYGLGSSSNDQIIHNQFLGCFKYLSLSWEQPQHRLLVGSYSHRYIGRNQPNFKDGIVNRLEGPRLYEFNGDSLFYNLKN